MSGTGPVRRCLLCCCALAVIVVSAAQATPSVPVDDQQVVETLPVRLDPELSALAGLRGQWLRNPADAGSAERLVRGYIAAARRNGDPRFLGYAESVLAHFGAGASAPPMLRILRATILQSLHRFDAAVEELSAVLAQQPLNTQALLTRATVLQVQGQYAAARRDCSQLWHGAGEAATALCLASVAAVTGGERAAAGLAERALDNARSDDLAVRVWALTLRAEIAARMGDAAVADRNFAQALVTDSNDRYARAAYCDLLLQQDRPAEVLKLTAGLLRDDNLLLRHALALQALAAAPATRSPARQRELTSAIALLRERHAAARLRGDATHLREQARLQLELLHDPAGALRLARANWAVQKEPADLQLLLAAATAAGDDAGLATAAAWVRATGLHDVHVESLLRQPLHRPA
jgi:tetratricopeptide (TPR) repeat protein